MADFCEDDECVEAVISGLRVARNLLSFLIPDQRILSKLQTKALHDEHGLWQCVRADCFSQSSNRDRLRQCAVEL